MASIAVFGRLHLSNLYTGVDGSSTIRSLLKDNFNVTWLSPSNSLVEHSPPPDLDYMARVAIYNGLDPWEFMYAAWADADFLVKDWNSSQAVPGIVQHGERMWWDCDALFVEWRSSQFPEFEAQARLLSAAKKRGVKTILLDTDGWMLQDRDILRFVEGERWRPYAQGPQKWTEVRYPFSARWLKNYDMAEDRRVFFLTYIGNDYNRREAMAKYFMTPERQLAGNWARTKQKEWNGGMMSSRQFMDAILKVKWYEFMGATPHCFVHAHYASSQASLYVQPTYYDELQHTTLRFFESLDVGCPPLIAYESSQAPIFQDYLQAFPQFLLTRDNRPRNLYQRWNSDWPSEALEWAQMYDEETKDKDFLHKLRVILD